MITLLALVAGIIAIVCYYVTSQKKTAAYAACVCFGFAGMTVFFVPGTSPIILINFFTAALWGMMAQDAYNE